MNCKNCKHWAIADAHPANADASRFMKFDHEADEFVFPPSGLSWSRCLRAEAGFDDGFNPVERKMAVWDGSRYFAELVTREDFGCCEHGVREP